MNDAFTSRGFLPACDPRRAFPAGSRYRMLDEIGDELPERLLAPGVPAWAARFSNPEWREPLSAELLPQLRLYYVRLGFLVSGYVNQIAVPPTQRVPASLARPFADAGRVLDRPAILPYDGDSFY